MMYCGYMSCEYVQLEVQMEFLSGDIYGVVDYIGLQFREFLIRVGNI